MEERYEATILQEILKNFNSIYIVDVTLDKVYSYAIVDGELKVSTVLSFFDFMQNKTKEIYDKDVNGYFDNISIDKIENNGGSTFYNYKIKSDNSTDFRKCISISKVLPSNTGKIVLSTSIYDDSLDIENIELKEIKTKFSAVTNMISDTILKIYNALDSAVVNSDTSGYITNLLEQLVREFPEFNRALEKNIISQVNKVNNTLLIVDDDAMTRNLIKKTFNDKYEIIMATNGKEAIETLNKIGFDNIVGIFLDIMMPVADGFVVLDYLREKNILSKIPVIIISGTEEKETRQRVYKYNIADLLEKPFNLEIIKYRTKNLINLYKTSNSLNNMVFSQHNDLMGILEEIVKSYKYDNMSDILNIKVYFKKIIEQVLSDWPEYKLSSYEVDKITEAIEFYNIGLYLIPRYLGKNGNISDEEMNIIKRHPILGNRIVNKILIGTKDETLLSYASSITSMCYEKYDGSGYPNGISGEDIPFWIQCVSLSIDINNSVKNNENIDNLVRKISGKYNPKIIDSLEKILTSIV